MNKVSRRNDPVWEMALDWLMRVQADPHDSDLLHRRDRWLAEAEEHAKAYGRAEKVWGLTGQVAPSAPLVGAAATPAFRRTGVSYRRAVMGGLALAACLAVVALPGLNQRLRADYRTGTAETKTISLADGSTIALDAESAVDVSLAAQERRVSLLSGRAFFQVSPDKARPFVVSAGDMTVRVTGTAFDVSTLAGREEVTVQSGTVAVKDQHSGGDASIALGAGGRARLSPGDGVGLSVDTVPPAQVGLWRSGRMVVKGASVAQVVDEIRPHYHGLIVLADGALAGQQVTGVFDMDDPVQALDAVLQPHGGKVRQMTPYMLVLSGR